MKEAQYPNIIAGIATEPAQGGWVYSLSPWQGVGATDAAQVASSTLIDVVKAIQAANKAFVAWSQLGAPERSQLLKAIAQKIKEHAPLLAMAQVLDQGSLFTPSLKISTARATQRFEQHAVHLEAPSQPTSPLGVVAAITSWRDPILAISERVAAAIAAGNAVIVKPSSSTPRVAAGLMKCFIEAGLPTGLVNLLYGDQSIGETLIQHPAIRAVIFDGDTESGKNAARVAGENFKPIHLSLSANNPIMVFQSAELEFAVNESARLISGYYPDVSLRATRLFIQESVYKPYLFKLEQRLSELRAGATPGDQDATLAPLAQPQLQRSFAEAQALALAESGKPLLSSAVNRDEIRSPFVQPFVAWDLTHCSTLQLAETVGPFAVASSFKYQHEAIKHVNTSPMMRSAYVFEADSEKAHKIAAKCAAGLVFIQRGPWDGSDKDASQEAKTAYSLSGDGGRGEFGIDGLYRFLSRRSAYV